DEEELVYAGIIAQPVRAELKRHLLREDLTTIPSLLSVKVAFKEKDALRKATLPTCALDVHPPQRAALGIIGDPCSRGNRDQFRNVRVIEVTKEIELRGELKGSARCTTRLCYEETPIRRHRDAIKTPPCTKVAVVVAIKHFSILTAGHTTYLLAQPQRQSLPL